MSVSALHKAPELRHETLRIAGERVETKERIDVTYPYTGEVIGSVGKATLDVNYGYLLALYM